jgi:hypothetical protein
MAATWIIPFIAALLIALNTAYAVMMQDSRPSDWYDFYLFVALMWAHVAIVVPLLWLLKPTRLFAVFADQADQRRWQFSTGHLLVVMTCSAVLLVVLGKSGWLVDSNLASFGSLLIGNAILLVAIVVSTLSHWHWLLRLAASLAAAFIVAEVCELTDSAFASALNLVAYNLVQSMVVWSWLEVIRPPRRDEVASDEKPKRLVPAP